MDNLKKYESIENITSKWISLNKKLNKNKDSNYYCRIVLDAQSITEHILDITLLNNKNYDKSENLSLVKKLYRVKDMGKNIPKELIDRVYKIKQYRNQVAHGTETTIQDIIDLNIAQEALDIYGEVLCHLGYLKREDIVTNVSKLKAKEGDIIDDTIILKNIIGEGSTCRVFWGFHKRLNTEVAVKEIKHTVLNSDVIENEKNILISLKNDGIPVIYDVIAANRTYYIVMEYIKGDTLENSVKEMGSYSINAIANIGGQLCRIINYLHSKGIILNDLKPSNIIVDDNNKVTIIDFGIASTVKQNSSGTTYSGSYVYSAPESLKGKNKMKSNDVYSLGATIYFMSEGIEPIGGSNQRFKRSTNNKLIKIIEKAMAPLQERYKNLTDIESDLSLVSLGKEPKNANSQDKTVPDESKRKDRINLKFVVATIVVGIILCGIGIWGITNKIVNNNSDNLENAKNKITDTVSNVSENINTDNSKDNNAAEGTIEKTTEGTTESTSIEGTAFRGEVKVTIKEYKINGDEIVLNINIINNYEGEINISPDEVYIMNENGKKFGMNIHKQLANGGGDFGHLASGENKDVTLYLKDYVKSNNLTLKIDDIWCMSFDYDDNEKKIEIPIL